MMRVHVTLRRDICHDRERKLAAFDHVVEVSGISEVNQKRFERYGIISGRLRDQRQVDRLKRLAEVDSVTEDEEKTAIRS